jgi:hypothetical protein
MKITIVLAGLFLSHLAFSAISGEATITGTIVKVGKKSVVLSQQGSRTKVLRSSIPKHYKIKKGNEVTSALDSKKVVSQIKSTAKKNRRKRK